MRRGKTGSRRSAGGLGERSLAVPQDAQPHSFVGNSVPNLIDPHGLLPILSVVNQNPPECAQVSNCPRCKKKWCCIPPFCTCSYKNPPCDASSSDHGIIAHFPKGC